MKEKHMAKKKSKENSGNRSAAPNSPATYYIVHSGSEVSQGIPDLSCSPEGAFASMQEAREFAEQTAQDEHNTNGEHVRVTIYEVIAVEVYRAEVKIVSENLRDPKNF